MTVWGDINNNESCRAKAQLCRNFDESVRVWIDGKPSKSKINDFSNEHKELIQAFDDFIVEFCYVSGLVEGNEFVGDGTFLDAVLATNFDSKKIYAGVNTGTLGFLHLVVDRQNQEPFSPA